MTSAPLATIAAPSPALFAAATNFPFSANANANPNPNHPPCQLQELKGTPTLPLHCQYNFQYHCHYHYQYQNQYQYQYQYQTQSQKPNPGCLLANESLQLIESLQGDFRQYLTSGSEQANFCPCPSPCPCLLLHPISPCTPLASQIPSSFTGTPSEMRDLLSILAEFNLPPLPLPLQPHSQTSKVSLLVPYFDWTRRRAKAASNVSLLNFPTETVAPSDSKCKRTNKEKPAHKKRQKKNSSNHRDIFQKNYFHACESLLSLLLDKSSASTGRGSGEAILSLKRLGPEIAHILTSFSIGIAGTGLAVLFSVACKMSGPRARVPLSATRFFNAGIGLGLFWLSWAVNGLRDTIMQVFRSSNKLKMKHEEMTMKVERSMRDVLLRAGALVALAVLRFACEV